MEKIKFKRPKYRERFEYATELAEKMNAKLDAYKGTDCYLFYEDELLKMSRFSCCDFGFCLGNIGYISMETYEDGKVYFPSKKKIDAVVKKFKILKVTPENMSSLLEVS